MLPPKLRLEPGCVLLAPDGRLPEAFGLLLDLRAPRLGKGWRRQSATPVTIPVAHVVDRAALLARSKVERRTALAAELRARGICVIAEGAVDRLHAAPCIDERGR